jgi:hypothetical protein
VYSTENFKSRKSLREAVARGPVPCFQPGPFGPGLPDGVHVCEGPHYPQPHRWYASVTVRNGMIVEVKK